MNFKNKDYNDLTIPNLKNNKLEKAYTVKDKKEVKNMVKEKEDKKEIMKKLSNSIIMKNKRKGLFGIFRKMVYEDLKDPILEIIRHDGQIEVIPDVKAGQYKIPHSDGNKRMINLKLNKLLYRKDKENKRLIRTWIIYEDEIDSYPQDPLADSEIIYSFIDKVKSSSKEYELGQIRGMNTTIWTIAKSIGLIIAIIMGIFIVANLLAPSLIDKIFTKTPEIIQVVNNTTGGGSNPTIFQ